MLNYKSYYDLSRDIAANIQNLPHVDMVVGVPKSGIVPATIIASFLNTSMIDIDSFIFSFTKRKGVRKEKGSAQAKSRVLIVDDSVNTGNEFRRVRTRVAHLEDEFEFVYCAVYGVEPGAHQDVADIVLTDIPHPRFFQWNYRNHIVAESACFDMDGVLCIDPPEDKNDDGELYRDYILNAPPLFIPRKKISSIVTSRLERFRPETEEWLQKHNVAYGELIMLDLPTAEERRRLRAHAPFKSEVYAGRDELLFVESNWKQAKAIAVATDKPVICTENDAYLPDADSAKALGNTKQLFSPEQIDLEASLRREVVKLTDRLNNENASFRKSLAAAETFAAGRKRKATPLEKERAFQKTLREPQRPEIEVSPKGDKKRVLMISRTFDAKVGAGAAVSSARLRDALSDQGVEVYTLSEDDIPISREQKAYQPLFGSRIGFWSHMHDEEHSGYVREQIERIDPDAIILGAIDNGIVSILDLALIRRPIVWIARDNWSHTGGCLFKLEPEAVKTPAGVDPEFLNALTCTGYKNGCPDCPALIREEEQSLATLQYKLKKLVYSHRKDIVFAPISDWMNSSLASAPLTQDHTIATVHNSIDFEKIKPTLGAKPALRAKLDLPTDKKLVLLNAHSLKNPRKGLALVLDNLESVPALNAVEFVVVGRADASEFPESLRSRLHSFGFIDDQKTLLDVYNAVDAVLVPALQESLSVVASDAIVTGTPVVAFEAGGLVDLITHKVTGWLAPAYDATDLLQGLAWVLFEADQDKLSEACISHAREVLDARNNAPRLLGAVERAIEQFGDLPPLSDTIETTADILADVYQKQMFQRQHLSDLKRAAKSGGKGGNRAAAEDSRTPFGYVIRGKMSPRHLTLAHRIITASRGHNLAISVAFEDIEWARTTWAGKHLEELADINVYGDVNALDGMNVSEFRATDDGMTLWRPAAGRKGQPEPEDGTSVAQEDVNEARLPYFLSPNLTADVARLKLAPASSLIVISRQNESWMVPMGTSGYFKATLPCKEEDHGKLLVFGSKLSENNLLETIMIARLLKREPYRLIETNVARDLSPSELGGALMKDARLIRKQTDALVGIIDETLGDILADVVPDLVKPDGTKADGTTFERDLILRSDIPATGL